jgi:hypothetical protein
MTVASGQITPMTWRYISSKTLWVCIMSWVSNLTDKKFCEINAIPNVVTGFQYMLEIKCGKTKFQLSDSAANNLHLPDDITDNRCRWQYSDQPGFHSWQGTEFCFLLWHQIGSGTLLCLLFYGKLWVLLWEQSRYMKLTIHLHLVPEMMNTWNYTSSIHGEVKTGTAIFFIYDIMVVNKRVQISKILFQILCSCLIKKWKMYKYKTAIKCVQTYTVSIKCSHEALLKCYFIHAYEIPVLYEKLKMQGWQPAITSVTIQRLRYQTDSPWKTKHTNHFVRFIYSL